MILLLLIFIAVILLFGAAAVRAGLAKGFLAIVAILAISGIIVSLSGDISKGEALPIFIGVSISFILIIALICFVGYKILTKNTTDAKDTAKKSKLKTIFLYVVLWCATVASLFFSICFFTKHYHYGYNSVVSGTIFLISAILLCPLVIVRLIKQPKFRLVSVTCGIIIFAGYLCFISSDTYYWSDGFVQYRQVRTAEQIEALFSDYSLDASATVNDKYCNQVSVTCPNMDNCTDDDLIAIGKALQEYDSFDLECSVESNTTTYNFLTDFHDGITITKGSQQIYPQERESSSDSTSNNTGEYWCMGKNDTCQNKTTSPDDFFCDECDPNGDNIEG